MINLLVITWCVQNAITLVGGGVIDLQNWYIFFECVFFSENKVRFYDSVFVKAMSQLFQSIDFMLIV